MTTIEPGLLETIRRSGSQASRAAIFVPTLSEIASEKAIVDTWQIRVKYALDRAVAVVMVLVLAPLFALIAVLIKLDDRGPVFFRQPRLGLGGRVFEIWKFRTMIVNADDYLNEAGEAIVNRVTRTGRVLRYTSLDELPQLINILAGEMSFVGPRPALVERREQFSDEQRKRLAVRPGITGLAQVNGRNTLAWSKRIEYDIQYVTGYSLLKDIAIIFKTISVVFLRKGVAPDRNPSQVDDLRR